MKPTRRQFLQTALTGAALLAAGEALALGDTPAAPTAASVPGVTGEWRTAKVADGSEMRLYVARPKAQKAPGILVLQEIFGVNSYIRSVADRIAGLGYVAAAPDLFHRTAPGFEGGYSDPKPGMEEMKKMTDEGLEADLKATFDFLIHDDQVNSQRIGSVGYCMGGKASFIANATLPIQAAVSYYGGGIADTQLDKAKDQHAPILMFWGGKDDHIGRNKQNAVAKALKEAGKRYVDVEFSEAGHGFFCDQRSSYHAESARESWALFQAFFQEHLGVGA